MLGEEITRIFRKINGTTIILMSAYELKEDRIDELMEKLSKYELQIFKICYNIIGNVFIIY